MDAYEICITAQIMMQIQELEEGSIDLTDFIDDDALRKKNRHKAKQGHLDESRGASGSPSRTKANPTAEKDHEVKSMPVKVEIGGL